MLVVKGGYIAVYNPHVTPREAAFIYDILGFSTARASWTRHLLGLGQTNGVLAKVVNAVPLAQERVTKNGQRTNGLGEVHSHEAADAGALNLQDVVVGGDGEVVTAQSEGEVRQRITGGAVNGVLASEALRGTNLFVPVYKISTEPTKLGNDGNLQKLSHGGGQSNERSTSVKDDTGVLHLSDVLAKGKGVELNLPVSLAAEGNIDQLACVVALVHTTEGGLGVITLLVAVAQVESKLGLIQESLVDHVVEGRNHLVDRDGVVSQTQDTIETAESKGQARLAGSLSKVLLGNLQVADRHGILGDETAQAARSILDRELGAVLLV